MTTCTKIPIKANALWEGPDIFSCHDYLDLGSDYLTSKKQNKKTDVMESYCKTKPYSICDSRGSKI